MQDLNAVDLNGAMTWLKDLPFQWAWR